MSVTPVAIAASSQYNAESSLNIERTLRTLQEYFYVGQVEELPDDPPESPYERKHEFEEWREWYVANYPHTEPESVMEKDGKNVDLRVVFMAFPIAAYSILLLLEACYEVDKAICGTDSVAQGSIRQWQLPHEYGAYTYLLSEEMVFWWKRELIELSDEIQNGKTNRVSVVIRVQDIASGKRKLERVVNSGWGFCDSIWESISTTILEGGIDMPAGVGDAIDSRVDLLVKSVDILQNELEQTKSRTNNEVRLVSASAENIEASGTYLEANIGSQRGLQSTRTQEANS
jgi:hypothetical protein